MDDFSIPCDYLTSPIPSSDYLTSPVQPSDHFFSPAPLSFSFSPQNVPLSFSFSPQNVANRNAATFIDTTEPFCPNRLADLKNELATDTLAYERKWESNERTYKRLVANLQDNKGSLPMISVDLPKEIELC